MNSRTRGVAQVDHTGTCVRVRDQHGRVATVYVRDEATAQAVATLLRAVAVPAPPTRCIECHTPMPETGVCADCRAERGALIRSICSAVPQS